jgi:hypothetical protein
MLRNMKTHQLKLRQSCREYHAVKAGDLVASLRMTRKRQMQRRNKINHATSAPHAPRTSRTYTTKQCLKIKNACNHENSPNEAPSILQGIPRHQGW